MKVIFAKFAFAAALAAMPVHAAAQGLEGRWVNPHHSVIVKVSRCGNAYCGTVGWANDNNRKKGVGPGSRVLSDLKPQGGGIYKGRAFDPKRGVGGSATVRQVGPDVMLVKGCVVAGILCKEQRWTRVG